MGRKQRKITEFRMYELPQEFPAILLSGDQWYISSEASSRLHFHNCTEIGLCVNGSGILEFEGKKTAFRTDDISLISKHIPHTTYSDKDSGKSLWSYIFLDFSGILKDNLSVGDICEAAGIFNEDNNPNIHYFAKCLFKELQNKQQNGCRQLFKAVSLALYHEVCRLHDQQSEVVPPTRSFVLKPALDYINENYMHRISIKELAYVCGFSENHFRRQFNAIMGKPPHSFITTMRINRACTLLNTTNHSILAVSEAVGMSSIASFNRNFKQIMGQSPGDYRRSTANVVKYKGWTKAEERPEFVDSEF